MTAASVSFAKPAAAPPGFALGKPLDLARPGACATSAEICEAMPPSEQRSVWPERAWALDFAAFCLVINALVVVMKFTPIG